MILKYFFESGNANTYDHMLKGCCKMRFSEKGELSSSMNRNIFGVDFHDRLERQEQNLANEMASEYGVSPHEVKKIKKQISRS